MSKSRKDSTKRNILDSAVALIAEQGVRAFSFREVARRAKVSHQAPYHFFGSAQGILQAVAQEGFVALTAAMAEAADRESEPLRRLGASGIAYVVFAATHPGHFRVMFQNSLIPIYDDKNSLSESARTQELLRGLCRDVQNQGYAGELSLEIFSLMSWSLVHGLACLSVENAIEGKRLPGVADRAALTQQLLQGFGALLRKGGS